VTPQALREKLGLSRSTWARSLGVNERTVTRWEDGDSEPSGLAAEVIRGLTSALDAGVSPELAGRKVSLGIGALLCGGLTRSR